MTNLAILESDFNLGPTDPDAWVDVKDQSPEQGETHNHPGSEVSVGDSVNNLVQGN